MSELRLSAYYFNFDATGERSVDLILSAVACAGKAFHLTEDWNSESEPYEEAHVGRTPVEWIQNAANAHASELTSLRAEVERLKAELAQLNGTPQRRFLRIMEELERILGPHPSPYRSDEDAEKHYLRVVERLRAKLAKGEALAKKTKRITTAWDFSEIGQVDGWHIDNARAALAEWDRDPEGT